MPAIASGPSSLRCIFSPPPMLYANGVPESRCKNISNFAGIGAGRWGLFRAGQKIPGRSARYSRCTYARLVTETLGRVLFVVYYVRGAMGDGGLMATGFVLGLTDVDALTLSMTRSVATGTSIDAAARAIVVGIVANSIMKAGIAAAIGSKRFKWQAAAALIAMAAAGGGALMLL